MRPKCSALRAHPSRPPIEHPVVHAGPLPFGGFGSGIHVEVPDGVLTPETVRVVIDLAATPQLVVTPWRGLVLPAR